MIRRPTRSTRADTLFPYTTLFRSVRVLERVAYAGLGGEVDHPLRLEVCEGGFDCRAVFQRFAAEGEALQWRQPRQPGFLQPRVVVVVEVVVAQDFVTARQQALAEFRADEAGGAGDEDAHGGVLGWRIGGKDRSEAHTSELQSLMRTSYAGFCLK